MSQLSPEQLAEQIAWLERERDALRATLPRSPQAQLAELEAAHQRAKARTSRAEDDVRRFEPPPDPEAPHVSAGEDEEARRQAAWDKKRETAWREWERRRGPRLEALARAREDEARARRSSKALEGKLQVLARIDERIAALRDGG